MLDKSQMEYFDEYFKWRVGGKYLSREERVKSLAFLILFGTLRKETDTWDICSQDDCFTPSRDGKGKGCPMYEPGRCDRCITNKYYDRNPSRMRGALAQREPELNDYKFYKMIRVAIENNINQLLIVVGAYRIELFYEEMIRRGNKSVMKHLKRTPRETADKYFEVTTHEDPKYFDAKYIEENDYWTIFKETQIEGELLCSLLSDF